jgi:hypothetical protein
MRVRDLIKHWEETAADTLTAREFSIRLPVREAARVMALAEIYQTRSVEQILSDLLGAALDEVEEALPYVQGSRVISEDDRGDPIYADAGPTPRFRELTERFARELRDEGLRRRR